MTRSFHKSVVLLINALFFGLLLLIWGVIYPNHLIQKEQMQLFLVSLDYLFTHLSIQGGLAIWIGEWLTQFFIYPSIGAFVISGLIFSIYYSSLTLLKRLFTNDYPILAFVPALSYCMLLFNDFYYLSGVLATSVSIWSLVLYLKFPTSRIRVGYGLLMILLLYWLFGGTYILFCLSIVVIELKRGLKGNAQNKSLPMFLWISAIYLLVGLVVPWFVRIFLVTDTLLQCYFSSVFYKFPIIIPTQIILILISVPIIISLYSFFQFEHRWQIIFNSIIGIILAALTSYGIFTLPDFAEEKEMKYDNLVYHQYWNEIIKEAEIEIPKGRQARLALMLALGKTNQLNSKLFSFEPKHNDFFISYQMHGMAPFITNEPYYWLGLINYSQMLAMESIESMPDAKLPVRAVKRYAETCIITGQYEIAAKYLGLLEQTLFYKNWAQEAKQFLYHDDKVMAHPEWGPLRDQQVKDEFYFQNENADQLLFYLLRGNSGNRLAFEYLMAFYLLEKDFDRFLEFLPLLREMNYDELPLLYQEALVYIESLLPEVPDAFKQYPVSPEVRARIASYAKAFQIGGSNNPQMMKKAFGNSYWYYVHFSELHER